MPNLRRILFPYDFSQQGRQTVPFVRALAKRFGAHITLFSVAPPAFDLAPPGMDPRIRAGDDAAEWREALQSRLDQALVDELAGLGVERIADTGDPALRIAAFAHSRNVDLITMPTHGVGLFRTLLVGSVTSKVLHDADCPVWTAAHAETQAASEMPRHILCAVGRETTTPGLARWAAEFSDGAGAQLSLLHVISPVSDWASLGSERRLQEEARERAQRAMELILEAAGIDAPLRVVVGDVVAAATEEARQQRADLVIIGRGSVAEPFGRFRTHGFGIIQRSPCPVISV